MGQDDNLTWGNIVGTMITTSDEDQRSKMECNHLVTDFDMIYDYDNDM